MKMQVPGQNKDVFTYPYLQTRQSPHNQSIPKLQLYKISKAGNTRELKVIDINVNSLIF